MNKKEVCKELGLSERELDWLEGDYLRIHKENIDRVLNSKTYARWYVEALKEWKSKRV